MLTFDSQSSGTAPRHCRCPLNVQLLRRSGVPLVGFTWYSLTDQVDWHNAMSEAVGLVFRLGSRTSTRTPRAVGLSYKYLIGLYGGEREYRECPSMMELMRK